MTQKELQRIDDLQRQIERLEKKLMALQEAFACSVTWTAQTAGSPLSATDVKLILERLI